MRQSPNIQVPQKLGRPRSQAPPRPAPVILDPGRCLPTSAGRHAVVTGLSEMTYLKVVRLPARDAPARAQVTAYIAFGFSKEIDAVCSVANGQWLEHDHEQRRRS